MKKSFLSVLLCLSATLFSCNNGRNAGAGTSGDQQLKPGPGGVAQDTSSPKNNNKSSGVDTTAAQLPTDTGTYKRGSNATGNGHNQ